MTDAGEPVSWRAHFNQLIARPIPEKEFPQIVKKMFEDGLIAVLTVDGLKWYSGRYEVQKIVVRRMWSLTRGQWDRFNRWVYMNEPFNDIIESE